MITANGYIWATAFGMLFFARGIRTATRPFRERADLMFICLVVSIILYQRRHISSKWIKNTSGGPVDIRDIMPIYPVSLVG